MKMAEIVCDSDFCKHYKNGRCDVAVIEICNGRCRDLEEKEKFDSKGTYQEAK